jgi:hypothetical protein
MCPVPRLEPEFEQESRAKFEFHGLVQNDRFWAKILNSARERKKTCPVPRLVPVLRSRIERKNRRQNNLTLGGYYESLSFRGSSQFVVLGFGFTKVDTKVENFCRAERCVAALSVAMTSASLLSLLTMPCTTSSYLRSLSSCRSIGVSSDRPLRDTMRAGTRRFCRVLRRSRGILGP